MWPLLVAELVVSALFITLLVRAVRRYDRHLDQIEAGFDRERHAIAEAVRARVDQVIAELRVDGGRAAEFQTAEDSARSEPVSP